LLSHSTLVECLLEGLFNREGSPAIFLPRENALNQYQDPWLSLPISR
jgi:hypothetical protein